MSLSKLPNESDSVAIRQSIQRLNKALDSKAIPTWQSISVTNGASFGSNVGISGTLTVSAIAVSSATISVLGVTSGNVVEGWAVGSTLTAAAISVAGVISGGAGIFTTISAGTGSFSSANFSGGIAVVSDIHTVAISATGVISAGHGIFTTISAGVASFTSVNISGGLAVVSGLHIATISATGNISADNAIFTTLSTGAGSFTSGNISGSIAIDSTLATGTNLSGFTGVYDIVANSSGGGVILNRTGGGEPFVRLTTDNAGGAQLRGLVAGGLRITSSAGTGNRVTILSTGYVGINTANPTRNLDVAGDIGLTKGAIAGIGTTDNYALHIYTNGNDRVTIGTTGNVVVSGTLTVNGNQTGATDHVFDDYDDIELLHKWRDGEVLPFETGDMLSRDRLLRDTIIQLVKRIEKLEKG